MSDVLADHPMTQTELVVAMMEAGYETTMSRKTLRDGNGVAMRKDDRFKKVGDRWAVS